MNWFGLWLRENWVPVLALALVLFALALVGIAVVTGSVFLLAEAGVVLLAAIALGILSLRT